MDRTYTVAAGATGNDYLPFKAVAIRVDNPGGQWFHEIRTNQYVSPWRLGAVLLIPRDELVTFDTVPPAGQANTGAGDAATVVYTDTALPASPGTDISTLYLGGGLVLASAQQLLSLAGSQLVIDSGETLPAGATYRLGFLSAYAVGQLSTTTAISCRWRLGLGSNPTSASGTLLALGGMIAGRGGTSGGDDSPGLLVVPAADARPAIDGDGATSVRFILDRLDNGSWGANGLIAGFYAVLVPATT